MDDKAERIMQRVITFVVAIPIYMVLSLIPVAMWYCIDDFVVGVSGVAWLGAIPFWHLWVANYLWMNILRAPAVMIATLAEAGNNKAGA